ncbi:MAG: hypothetical protein ABJF50_21105 [Paracoccaceae bacterium]
MVTSSNPTLIVTEAHRKLTVELVGYLLLRLTRYCIESEFELLSHTIPFNFDGTQTEAKFNAIAQRKADLGAFCVGNSVTAFNRTRATIEDLKILEQVSPAMLKVIVPFQCLDEHLTNTNAIDAELFEFSLYHFYNCHSQTEWGSESWYSDAVTWKGGTEVSILPGLQQRFEQAGLLIQSGQSNDQIEWSQLMDKCIDPLRTEHSPEQFFEQIYTYEAVDE